MSHAPRFTRRTLALASVFSLALGAGAPIWAQAFPERPITLIVPYAPGATDQEARRLADLMSKELGQPVVVDNRTGAGGAIGTQAVARAKPDGYTLLYAAPAVITVVPLLGSAQYRYEDLVPVARSTTSPHVMAIRTDAPFKTLPEMISYAKQNPGRVVFASSGTGTAVHLAGEAFARAAGIEVNHVPHRGLAPAIIAALGGFADFVIGLPVAIKPQVDGGRLSAIAQFGATRAATMAEVPTLREQGVGIELGVDIGLFAPKGTPNAIVARLNQAVKQAVGSPEFAAFAQGALVLPAYLDSAAYHRVVEAERTLYERTVPGLKLN